MLLLNSWNATSGAVGQVDRFPCRQLCIIGLDGVADVAVFGIVELTPGAELCAETSGLCREPDGEAQGAQGGGVRGVIAPPRRRLFKRKLRKK
jgi:hypothetical protein